MTVDRTSKSHALAHLVVDAAYAVFARGGVMSATVPFGTDLPVSPAIARAGIDETIRRMGRSNRPRLQDLNCQRMSLVGDR